MKESVYMKSPSKQAEKGRLSMTKGVSLGFQRPLGCCSGLELWGGPQKWQGDLWSPVQLSHMPTSAFFLKKIVWLPWVLVAAWGPLVVACGI